MNAVNAFVDQLRTRLGREIPYVDSVAGEKARIILVSRQPNMAGAMATGQLSLDNPDLAAGALRARLAESGVPLAELLFWNIIPWSPRGDLKSPSQSELIEGAQILEELLTVMTSPRLSVVLLGRYAALGGEHVQWGRRGGVSVFESPSYSPPEGNRSETRERVREVLQQAYARVQEPSDKTLAGGLKPQPTPPSPPHGPVTDRSDVEGKLSECDDWVRGEFAKLQSTCASHAALSNDESGPGRRFKTGGGKWFCRLHPKLDYIAVGFPNEMREKVAATGRLRGQLEAAWIKYDRPMPRETITQLIADALKMLSAGQGAPASLRLEPGPTDKRPRVFGHSTEATDGPVRDFEAAMRNIYDRAVRECRYHPTYFLQMINERGGVAAAKALIAGRASEGFARLWELKRLDLSVEALVQDPRWHDLFTNEERAGAARRLRESGYAVHNT